MFCLGDESECKPFSKWRKVGARFFTVGAECADAQVDEAMLYPSIQNNSGGNGLELDTSVQPMCSLI
jgi:hypothetical protein